ncbi:DUF4065 domain-containing protein [Cupriavidus necator]|uniref:DUF4065 domain-containing protein n=2 Tax=Cupriavidus necator TaxID=106590 RepID=A0A367PHQ2_CUPNE|nr:DUF4065 domain-containing protein [Cupriavidus necator]
MATVFDVARYILEKQGEMTAMKLQKLVYYSQAWSLVWEERPLFNASIEAWANGPVVRSLYDCHRGQFRVSPESLARGTAAALDEADASTVDGVLEFYGDKTAQWLSDLTHMEAPWKKARERAGLGDGEPGESVISLSDIHEYYSGLE